MISLTTSISGYIIPEVCIYYGRARLPSCLCVYPFPPHDLYTHTHRCFPCSLRLSITYVFISPDIVLRSPSSFFSDQPRMYPYPLHRPLGPATPTQPCVAPAFARLVRPTHTLHTKFAFAFASHIRYPDLLRYPAYLSSPNPARVDAGAVDRTYIVLLCLCPSPVFYERCDIMRVLQLDVRYRCTRLAQGACQSPVRVHRWCVTSREGQTCSTGGIWGHPTSVEGTRPSGSSQVQGYRDYSRRPGCMKDSSRLVSPPVGDRASRDVSSFASDARR